MADTRLSKKDWIDAGFLALSTTGPEALKAEALARALGTTKGSFYWHFKDVPEFKSKMLLNWRAASLGALSSVLDEGGTAPQRLMRLAEFADGETRGYVPEPVIRGWALSDPAVRDALDEVDRLRRNYIAAVLADMGLTDPNFAHIVHAALIGLAMNAGHGNAREAMSTLLAAISALEDA
ncbi:TetR/AcrR family transcriptional regulator [Maritimibacter sp. DP1N21-5]|uniref:TetR/AcrR family transcriptional regulator n=1 Tax=Maritimibacter sp. DP1N21-5 TaxID=2836867 RepID=UPI001C487133|nr:TetR/AcrR family transcriptional regulator [Maritimibacter sp. DP1N21-5]MBV7407899.1 TetR/AcrR family transcriptional regulator [Maritimibacter sp. DP1N21-5]